MSWHSNDDEEEEDDDGDDDDDEDDDDGGVAAAGGDAVAVGLLITPLFFPSSSSFLCRVSSHSLQASRLFSVNKPMPSCSLVSQKNKQRSQVIVGQINCQ